MNNGSSLHYRTTILDHLIKIVPGLDVEQAYDYLDSCAESQLNHCYAMIKRKEHLALKELFKPYVIKPEQSTMEGF
jgi:anaerobic glycerol-3-phosphate dehydrogenase